MCIVIISVDTIPGSVAFTTIPFSLTRFARLTVNKVRAKFRIAINRNAPETSPFQDVEEIRKVETPYGISTRHHIDNTAPLFHQRNKFACQQIRSNIITTLTVRPPKPSSVMTPCFHCSGIIHQQTDGIPPFQHSFGKKPPQMQAKLSQCPIPQIYKRRCHAPAYPFTLSAFRTVTGHDYFISGCSHSTGYFRSHTTVLHRL